MNSFLYWVCGKAMWLNRIPRYGRTYRVLVPDDSQPDGGPVFGPAVWGWHWRGYWGINLLQKFNLMWKYFDEIERRNPGAVTGKDH